MSNMNIDILSNKLRNARNASNLFRQTSDGTGNVEVKEDEEQSAKLQAIIDLLVAAGYFRARIKGLSAFDKVVGGMTWCIESCNVDVDVDLLFQENLTIGQKIALTEKIVVVLPKMNCPHIIEPHQIQGLDFINIFPVIQWLVKRSLEFRQEMASSVRIYAKNQYNKMFPSRKPKENAVLSNLKLVSDSYRPQRHYKRKTTTQTDIEASIGITLLEYGQPDFHNISSNQKSEDLLANVQKNLQENIDSYDNLTEKDLKSLQTHYLALALELKDSNLDISGENQRLNLEHKKQLVVNRNTKLSNQKASLEEKVKECLTSLNSTKDKQSEAEEALKELEQKEINGADGIKDVQDLVVLCDNLKLQEVQFREHCQKELDRLRKLIEESKTGKHVDDDSPEIQKEIEAVNEKIKSTRLQLAKKNRTIAILQRELDEIPNRAEMAQYQRRFFELYNQISVKHKETKQYYTLYNTLEDTKTYMKKELSLLNSISENYPEAILSAESKEEFVSQLQKIVDGMRQSKLRVEQKLSEQRKAQSQSNGILLSLIEQQRKYFNAVKQLMVECRKQEMLVK